MTTTARDLPPPMPAPPAALARAVGQAIGRGIAYLARAAAPDGHWEDYALPVGPSDAWVTAYVGLALARAAPRVAALAGATVAAAAGRAAARGAAWLVAPRGYPAGWGYNDATGPDADSTAHALLLLRATGCGSERATQAADEAWLAARWRPGAGFATYPAVDGWGLAHPDVTPVVYRALAPRRRRALRAAVTDVLRGTQDADGSWPTYWWRTRHYATWHNRRLARTLGLALGPATVVGPDDSRMVHSAFDLAFVTANVVHAHGLTAATRPLVATLLSLQDAEGWWPGAPNLRVMRHDAADPWRTPTGTLYTDGAHLVTTASAVRVLAGIAARWSRR